MATDGAADGMQYETLGLFLGSLLKLQSSECLTADMIGQLGIKPTLLVQHVNCNRCRKSRAFDTLPALSIGFTFECG